MGFVASVGQGEVNGCMCRLRKLDMHNRDGGVGLENREV